MSSPTAAQVVTAAAHEAVARRAAGGLAQAGVRPGDRVAVLLPGSAGWLALVLGGLRSGVAVAPLDPGLTPAERRRLLGHLEPALVVDDPAALQRLLDGPPAELAPYPLSRPLHTTSGTTGRPKGVWSGLLDAAGAAALAGEERDLWGFDPADTHLVCSPLHHSAPLRFASGTLLAGGSVVLAGPFSPAGFVEAVVRQAPTTAFCVPAHLQRLLDGRTALPDLRGFRLLAHAGAPCRLSVKEAALRALPGGRLWEFYGSTEGQFTVCSEEQWRHRPGTVGTARPGRRLAVDADGMVWSTAPPYAGFTYWRDPAATATAWREHAGRAEFTVRDLGRLDADGFLFLDGRRDDLVISGGVNVYPAEVESVLAGCPGVEDVAVFGLPDERWGQRVCAAVVGAAVPSGLDAWARQHLAPAKRPKSWYAVADLPRTASGKVRRLDLPKLLDLDEELG